MAVVFKLTDPDEITRRLAFPTKPEWLTLGTKIGTLCNIPFEHLGVTYVDSDGDKVTLSSNEELQDYYRSYYHPNEPIKFAVLNLKSLRSKSSLPEIDPPSLENRTGNRNTFGKSDGIPLVFEVEDDWQRLPPFAGMFMPAVGEDSPHAYVETVDSDSQAPSNFDVMTEKGKKTDSEGSHDDRSSFAVKDDEPKIRDDVSSASSIINESTPVKLPVHVYDVSSEATVSLDSPQIAASSLPQAQSTPKPIAENLVASPDAAGEVRADSSSGEPPSASNVSLSQDVATLLNDLWGMFRSHPEVSESVRNIMRNVSTGKYWEAHRQAVTSAADEILRNAQGEAAGQLRSAEEEAGRRVSEALGRLFRSFEDLATVPNAPGMVFYYLS